MYLGLNQKEKVETMGAKITALVFGSLNVFLYVMAWFANIDNVKSTILFIVALGMSMYRFYRWAISSIQNKQLKDIRIERDRLQATREKLEMQEKEVEIQERLTLVQSRTARR